MIITVQGTNNQKHSSTGVISVLATLNAVSKNRKTLVLQLIDRTDKNIENMLMGSNGSKEIKSHGGLSSVGIDALMRYCETSRATQDTFDDFCKAMLNSDNLLDIAEVTNKIEFTTELESRKHVLNNIIENAKYVYDDVYILLTASETSLNIEISENADINIRCVPQSNEPCKIKKTEKTRIIVTDYDNTSSYGGNYLKKLHNIKSIYFMPHNIGYKDASISGKLLEFITKNKNIDKSDINFRFIQFMYQLLNSITGDEVITNDYEKSIFTKPYYKSLADKRLLDERNVTIITVKKGFKKTQKKQVVIDDTMKEE